MDNYFGYCGQEKYSLVRLLTQNNEDYIMKKYLVIIYKLKHNDIL